MICEVGINHQGSLEYAFALIDMAKNVGAEWVKFQKREPEVSTPKHMWDVQRDSIWDYDKTISYIDYRRRIEFGKKEYDAIDKYCRQIGIGWFASVWDIESADFMTQYWPPMMKVPSAHLTNYSLLDHINRLGFPIVLSTGMSTQEEIIKASRFLDSQPATMVMHCHSAYPAPDAELGLHMIGTLGATLAFVPIGYSSHSTSPFPALYAAVLGAVAIECHITVDRTLLGSDHRASLEKHGLEILSRELKRISVCMGDGRKKVWDSELPSRLKLRGY